CCAIAKTAESRTESPAPTASHPARLISCSFLSVDQFGRPRNGRVEPSTSLNRLLFSEYAQGWASFQGKLAGKGLVA
ncbi:MAG: hypothetical protein ACREIL_09635, partial [Nitrospiraceae bacterium]